MFELICFAFVNLLGAMSPGPDFAIVTRYGLSGSRKASMYASLGIATALVVHVTYCLLGVAVLLQTSPALFTAIRVCGSLYLGYLGIKMFFPGEKQQAVSPDIHRKAFTNGFLVNLLNPKATLFLMGLFTQFITPETSEWMQIAYGASVPLVALGWFSFLSYLLTHPKFLPHLQKYQRGFSLVMGAMLIVLAMIVLYTVF